VSARPPASEYAPFFAGYVSLVTEDDILPALEAQVDAVRARARACPADRETFRYAPGKWSVRELFGHVTDAERVFGYRAFGISRGDPASFPGFDEGEYIAHASFDTRPLAELVDELATVRQANLIVLRRLDEKAWLRRGTANGSSVSVRALAFIMAGHVRHHLGVLAERYGIG
jgi:hypothetical protein